MGRGSTVDLLPIVWLRFQLPFFKSLKILFQPHPLSAYKSEATMFGLTEIQARLSLCFHLVISLNSFTFSLTFLIILLD